MLTESLIILIITQVLALIRNSISADKHRKVVNEMLTKHDEKLVVHGTRLEINEAGLADVRGRLRAVEGAA